MDGIFIKGLKKPKNCYGCYFNISDCFCDITKGTIDRDDYSNEIECPMKECKVYKRNQFEEETQWIQE